MKELAKRFIGKKCIVYTVIDTTGTVTGVIKEVDDTGILIENKNELQAVNLEYIIRIREFPHKKNGKEKSVFFKTCFLIIYKPKRQASLKACLQSEIPVPTNEDFRSG